MGLPGFPELWNESGAEVTLRIDSKLLAAAESEDPRTTRKNAAEELRRIVSTVGTPGQPGERIRCVVSVNMLSEGWDADNVTHILGLRAFHSQLLCEQVVGRGLRRMNYVPDPDDEVFLICALDGDADWLVSEDTDLLDLKTSYPRPVIGRCAEIIDSLGI